MSEAIYVDRENMRRRMDQIVDLVDEVDAALAAIPSVTDGGTASALIGFVAGAAAEAANEYSGAVRLIEAVTDSVLEDMNATEGRIEREISELGEGLDR